MKKTLWIICSILIACSACKNKNQTDISGIEKNEIWIFDTLKIQKEIFPNNDSSKHGMKLFIELTFPTKYINNSVLPKIQSAFVFALLGESNDKLSPQEAFDSLEHKLLSECLELQMYAKDDNIDFTEYYNNITTSVFDTTSITITARTITSSYTGGAHGSHQTSYYTIDLETGSILREQDIFKPDYKTPLSLLLKELLKNNRNSSGYPITILDETAIIPNENFYFSKKGIVYVFNTYEIAPYSDGLIEITIPYTDIKNLFNQKYTLLASIKQDSILNMSLRENNIQ